jgi:hypothetical protein
MTYGPVELIVVATPEGHPGESLAEAIRDLVSADQVRIIDVAFVHTDAAGEVSFTELAELPDEAYAALGPNIKEVSGLIADDDLLELGAGLGPDRTAGVFLIEHHWAPRFDAEVRRAGAKVLLHLRVPRETVAEVQAVRRPRER